MEKLPNTYIYSYEFETGDVVKLKSGGLYMVVEATEDATNKVWVVWHDINGVTLRDKFHPFILNKYI